MNQTTSGVRLKSAPSTKVLARLVDVARRAPSIHNTQPWLWVGHRHGHLELRADRDRGLPAADPSGRHLLLSCGAALQHLLVAFDAFGLSADVDRLPDPGDPDLLARVNVNGRITQQRPELLEATLRRRTDRRRFTTWPLPPARLAELVNAVPQSPVALVPITSTSSRRRVELLLEEARRHQLGDAEVVAETALWLSRGGEDGIPPEVIPTELTGRSFPNRFTPVPADIVAPGIGGSDTLMVLATEGDAPLDWLRTGETLSALWLEATLRGVSVVPLSQVVEHPPTRQRLRLELPAAAPYPQVVARLGWQLIGRPDLPATPRRPLSAIWRVEP